MQAIYKNFAFWLYRSKQGLKVSTVQTMQMQLKQGLKVSTVQTTQMQLTQVNPSYQQHI